MAIEIEYSTRFGDTYVTAYVRILSLKINYVANHADIEMGTYKDEAARKQGKDPVSIELIRIAGDKFDDFFKELSLDNINGTINPAADIYNDLTLEEGGKYQNGKKLYDEKDDGKGGLKEVGKEEIIDDERRVLKKLAEKAPLDENPK